MKSSFPTCTTRKIGRRWFAIGLLPVPLTIEVFSNEPVPVNDVAMYLSRASRLFLNTTDHGNGPNGSLVLPQIEWSRIKQERSND